MNKQSILSFSKRVFVILFSCYAVFFLSSCEKDKKDPEVETASITGIAASQYFVSAKVIVKGDYKIIDYGFDYYIGSGISGTYFSDKKVSLGSIINSDTFSTVLNIGEISYYPSNYKCYARAYITNEKGTLYGNILATELVKMSLNSIEPNRGKSGDEIILHGNFFSLTPSENKVYFNYSEAAVVSATAKTLKVVVPYGISSYYNNTLTVKVETNGYESSLQDAFVLLSNPEGFSPNNGTWGTNIYISGSGMYNSSLYFDDVYISTNTNSSSNFYAYVPNNFLKKKFKLYLSSEGVKTEVPGGYFTMNDLSVNSPGSWQYSRGSSIYFYGNGFNPQSTFNRLILGNTSIVSNSSYSSYAYFDIPYTMALGSYDAKITNIIDTVTLSNQITIVAK